MRKIRCLFNKIPKYVYILLFISFILFIPALINQGIHGDDATFHIVNIMAMNENSSFFELPTRIRPLTANNFGYGSGIFYPQLIHMIILYIWKIFQIVNVPLSACIILFMFIFTFITSIFMRKLLYKYTSNSVVSTLGSIFYITYPYFIADIYRRSAYGEIISFLALPMIFLAIYNLLNEDNKIKFYIYFVLGFYLLFASHLISSIYVTLFTGIFILCHGKKIFKKNILIPFIVASLIAVFLSFDYIVPIFEHKFLGNYMVFQDSYMYSRNSVIDSVLPISNLFILGDKIATYIPIFILLLIGFMFYNFKKVKNIVDSKIIFGLSIVFVLAILLVTVPFIWKISPSILIMIQFAWRNCTYIGFSSCILASFGLLMFSKKYFKIVSISSLILILVSLIFLLINPVYTPKVNKIFSYRDGGMGWSREYLPKNAYDNLDYFLDRDNEIKLVSGNANIKVLNDNTPNLKFSIKTSDKVIVEIPRLYYLWYKIDLTDKDNQKTNINFYENDNGFIEFVVSESGIINVKYEKTLLSNVSYIVSTLTFGFFIGFICISYDLERKKLKAK